MVQDFGKWFYWHSIIWTWIRGSTCISLQSQKCWHQAYFKQSKLIASFPFVFICFVFKLLTLAWRHVSSAWEAPVLIEPLTTEPTKYFAEHAILILVELHLAAVKHYGVLQKPLRLLRSHGICHMPSLSNSSNYTSNQRPYACLITNVKGNLHTYHLYIAYVFR